MLTLYDCAGAPSPRRAKMFLVEKGIPFETIQVDLRAKEQMGDAFRAINPRCTVPALVLEDGDVLTENAGISAYLDAAFPDKPLLGSSPVEKAAIASWNSRVQFDGLSAIAEALRNRSKGMVGRALPGPRDLDQIPELADRGQKRTAWFLEDLNEQLSQNKYVAGDSYSVADITATICVDFAQWVKVTPLGTQTALLEWHERMKIRPSYTA